jgi:hypothetical protein
MNVRLRVVVSPLLSKELGKNRNKTRNSLTIGMKIDNLEKFAKTSLVAEVIPDRPGRE